MMLTDLAAICRKAGLKVEEVPGWRTRGHGGLKSVETVVCHHTAGPAKGNMPSLNVVKNGRAGLSGPLCNLGLGRDGTVYVVAAGVAYHAGVVGPVAHDNWHAIGIEAEATGRAKWPKVQMDAYVRLCAALVDAYDLSVADVLGHKEVAVPHGRKTDPNFSMAAFRHDVRAVGKVKPMNNVQAFREGVLALAKAHPIPENREVAHAAQAAIVERAQKMPEK